MSERITDELLIEYWKQEPLYGAESADLLRYLQAEREHCRKLEARILQLENGNEDYRIESADQRLHIIRQSEAIGKAKKLPEKWRLENGDYPESKQDCADELQAALNHADN
jgi:hypothetical protein